MVKIAENKNRNKNECVNPYKNKNKIEIKM